MEDDDTRFRVVCHSYDFPPQQQLHHFHCGGVPCLPRQRVVVVVAATAVAATVVVATVVVATVVVATVVAAATVLSQVKTPIVASTTTTTTT